MNEELSRRLRGEELALFGRIGASVSHELRNILAIIGQYAGLLDDLVELTGKGKSLDQEKLKTLSQKITGQVKNGTEAMERFSRFAHATDETITSFDLVALAANTAALTQRAVTLAGARLEVELPRQAIPIRTNAFSLQHAIVAAIEVALDFMDTSRPLTMKLGTHGTRAELLVSAGAGGADGARDDELSARISQLSDVVDELEGTLETSRESSVLSLALTFPIQ